MQQFLRASGERAVVLLVLTMLFWGGNAVAGKFAVGHVSPFLLTAARWLLAAALLLVVAHRHVAADWPVIRRHLLFLFVLGASGYAIFNGFLYSALLHTTALNATIVQAGMPMFIFALNFLAFRAATHWAQIAGYTLTLAGVLLAAGRGDFTRLAALEINLGDALMLAGAFVYGAYSVALGAKPRMHWLSFLAVLVVAAALTSLPLAAWEVAAGRVVWPVTPTAWGVILFTAVFPSLLGQGFWIRGNELIGANRASVYLNLMPIFGALLSVLLLGERFEPYHALALALVIGGIAIAQRLSRERAAGAAGP